MCKPQAITYNQLHPIHVTSAEVSVMRRDARATHRWAVVVLDHLIEIAGRPAGGLRCAPEMLTAMRLVYEAEHVAKRVPVRIGTRDGVSVHFLQWAESRLPGGPMSSNLLRLIRGSLARWREANPGVTPEVSGAGYCAV